jgi:hypothetical protein
MGIMNGCEKANPFALGVHWKCNPTNLTRHCHIIGESICKGIFG